MIVWSEVYRLRTKLCDIANRIELIKTIPIANAFLEFAKNDIRNFFEIPDIFYLVMNEKISMFEKKKFEFFFSHCRCVKNFKFSSQIDVC